MVGTALQAFKPAMWGFRVAERPDAQVAAGRLAALAAWREAGVQGRAGYAPFDQLPEQHFALVK